MKSFFTVFLLLPAIAQAFEVERSGFILGLTAGAHSTRIENDTYNISSNSGEAGSYDHVESLSGAFSSIRVGGGIGNRHAILALFEAYGYNGENKSTSYMHYLGPEYVFYGDRNYISDFVSISIGNTVSGNRHDKYLGTGINLGLGVDLYGIVVRFDSMFTAQEESSNKLNRTIVSNRLSISFMGY